PVAEFRLPIVRPMCSWCLFPRLSPPNPQFDGAIRNGLDVRLTDAIFPRSNHYAISERGRPARHGETPRPAASAGVPRRLFKDDVMNCHDRDVGLLGRAGRLPLWLLGALGAVLLVLAGCVTTSQQRGQAADEPETARYDLPTIGERTSVANAEPMMLGGV